MSDTAIPAPEKFTTSQHLNAIEQFLDYGVKSRIPDSRPRCDSNFGHRGYFSGIGWGARALRSLRDHLRKPPVARIIEEMRELTDEQRHEIVMSCCRHCGSLNPNCRCRNDD